MKRLTFALLFAASFAQAQTYNYTFTGTPGAILCSRVQPYQQYYSNLVENSTPPYPGALQPNNFHMPAFPNHSYPVANGGCPNMVGFVSANGATATLQEGSGNGWLRITSGTSTQSVELGAPVWTVPSTYPAEGESVPFSVDIPIVAVCNAICINATGNLHMSGHFHFNWQQHSVYRWNYVLKVWTDDDAEIDGQSPMAILD